GAKAGRFPGHEAARAGIAAMDIDVQGLGRVAGLDQFQRGLLGAPDQNCRWSGESAGDHLDAKLYEVQKYCSLTNHMWDGFWFLANRRAWEALPDDVRAVAAKRINAAGLNERDDVAKLNATLQQDLATKGLVFNRPDPAPFRDKLRTAGFYTEWKGKYGDEAWGLLEKSVGKLA